LIDICALSSATLSASALIVVEDLSTAFVFLAGRLILSSSTAMAVPARNNNNTNKASRIPATLQSVFLASNRGNEVHKPPPDNVAYKVFFRNWFFQRQGNTSKRRNIFGGGKRDGKAPAAGPEAKTVVTSTKSLKSTHVNHAKAGATVSEMREQKCGCCQ
jgi:hypothetical protein